MNKFVLGFVGSIFALGVICSVCIHKEIYEPKTFKEKLVEVQDFFEEAVGEKVSTPVKETYEWFSDYRLKNVLAYCWLEKNNKFITFNHSLIAKFEKKVNNKDILFQIILHEYTHCEGAIGHIEMYGHFMNDGGSPWLSKNQVKDQFKHYLKYYRQFYKNLGREEEDLGRAHALTISIDKDGNIRTQCTCSSCLGLER